MFGAEGILPKLDTAKPSSIHRYGPSLRDRLKQLRSKFIVAFERWSATGQNDSDKIKDFCMDARGEFTSVSQRIVVMF